MGALEILLSVTVPVLVGAAMTLASMSMAHRWEALTARLCFVVAGFLVVGLTLRWLADAEWEKLHKILVGLAVVLPTMLATMWADRWVRFRAIAVSPGGGDHNVTSHNQSGGITAHIVKGTENAERSSP
jgi:hypothetical protein